MNKSILVFLLCSVCKPVIGQVLINGQISVNGQMSALDVVGSGTGMAGYAGFHEINSVVNKQKKTLDYQDVEGTCFWDDQWNPALMVLKNGRRIKLKDVRLNSYSNEIHYLDAAKEEFVLKKGAVKRISFLDATDTSRITSVFQIFDDAKGITGSFVKVLNEGSVQAFKSVSTALKKGDYNQFRGKVTYRFVPKTIYFIRNGGTISSLRKISQSSLASVVKLDDTCMAWLKANDNKMKNEIDLVEFLAFYNSTKGN